MSPACGVASSAGSMVVDVLDAAVSSLAMALVRGVSCHDAYLLASVVTFEGLSCEKYPRALCSSV